MHRRPNTTDTKPPKFWYLFDALILWKYVDDLAVIAESVHGDDFALYVQAELQSAFGDEAAVTDEQEANWPRADRSPAEWLARAIMPLDGGIIAAVFSWVRHRRRLKFVNGLVRKEADRIREMQSRPKARASA
jgi:hypothetical protein